MVVKLSKFFAYAIFFILVLIYFSPKSGFYYLLESKLNNFSVVIDKEVVIDNGFSLSVKDASVNVKSIPSAQVSDINIKIFGLYNKISVKDIELASVASTMFPTIVKSIDVQYTILNPLNIKAQAIGDFGEAFINFNILDMHLRADVKPSQNMIKSHRQTLRSLKKSKEGVYSYDKTIKF